MAGALPCSITVHHGRRQASSGQPLSQPRVPVDAGWRVESDGEDANAGQMPPLFSFGDAWVLLTSGPHLSVTVFVLIFLFFIDLNTNFKNSYLELGVSKWSEPNFVGFIMKCSI